MKQDCIQSLATALTNTSLWRAGLDEKYPDHRNARAAKNLAIFRRRWCKSIVFKKSSYSVENFYGCSFDLSFCPFKKRPRIKIFNRLIVVNDDYFASCLISNQRFFGNPKFF